MTGNPFNDPDPDINLPEVDPALEFQEAEVREPVSEAEMQAAKEAAEAIENEAIVDEGVPTETPIPHAVDPEPVAVPKPDAANDAPKEAPKPAAPSEQPTEKVVLPRAAEATMLDSGYTPPEISNTEFGPVRPGPANIQRSKPVKPAPPIPAPRPAPLVVETETRSDPKESKLNLGILLGSLGTLLGAIALFIALSGGGLAADSVDSKIVKDKSLTSRDFAPNALPEGPRGEAGAQGAPGAKGEKGDRGERGQAGKAASITPTYQNETSASDASTKSVTADCPSGEKLVGGGANVEGTGGLVSGSTRQGNSWVASAAPREAGQGDFSITATAVCL